MPGLPVLQRDVTIALAFLGFVGPAVAQEVEVIKLRTAKPTLYKCETEAKLDDAAQKNVPKLPWKVLGAPTEAGLLRVTAGGETFCVRAYSVETNKPVAAAHECQEMVAANQPRSGATRGVGGAECRNPVISNPKGKK
jgi:hypothetical protein